MIQTKQPAATAEGRFEGWTWDETIEERAANGRGTSSRQLFTPKLLFLSNPMEDDKNPSSTDGKDIHRHSQTFCRGILLQKAFMEQVYIGRELHLLRFLHFHEYVW